MKRLDVEEAAQSDPVMLHLMPPVCEPGPSNAPPPELYPLLTAYHNQHESQHCLSLRIHKGTLRISSTA
eukprot:4526575-Prymnesium_polylepis.1